MIELTAQLEQVTDVRFVHTPARPGDANICQVGWVSRRSSLTPQYSSASIIRRGLHGHTNVYKG